MVMSTSASLGMRLLCASGYALWGVPRRSSHLGGRRRSATTLTNPRRNPSVSIKPLTRREGGWPGRARPSPGLWEWAPCNVVRVESSWFAFGVRIPPSPVGSANDVAVTSPGVTRCHGMSQGDRERCKYRDNVARCRKNVAQDRKITKREFTYQQKASTVYVGHGLRNS